MMPPLSVVSGEITMTTVEHQTPAGKAQPVSTEQMLSEERAAVSALRNGKTDGPWIGLALSGGGIRSASFAMGVMQGLDAVKVMERVDYLSTVSGGGYIGASLSYFICERARRHPGDKSFWFPFGRKGQSGARGDSVAGARSELHEGFAVKVVSFIRQHASYLTPTPKLGIFALIANALRAVLFALGIYFAMLVIVMTAVFGLGRSAVPLGPGDDACGCGLIQPAPEAPATATACVPLCIAGTSGAQACIAATPVPAASCPATDPGRCKRGPWTPFLLPCGGGGLNLFFILGALALVVAAAITLFYSIRSHSVGAPASSNEAGEPIRPYYSDVTIPLTAWLGVLLKVQLACLAFGSLPWTYGWAEQHGGGNLYGAISVAIAYLGTWREKNGIMVGKLKESGIWKSIWPTLYAVLAVYGILFLAYGVSGFLSDAHGTNWTVWSLLFVVIATLAVFTNLNLVSQHRMYRDRLMEALCPDRENVKAGIWGPATVADAMQLSVLAGGANSDKALTPKTDDPIKTDAAADRNAPSGVVGPYHLINTALIIPDSKQPKYSGRGADSFVFSPRYCGSDATDWVKTEEYMSDGMVLPTAMAISGAALNAHSGPDGKGVLRTPLVSFLVTLFGAQLGYWAPNPRKAGQKQQTANYLEPGLAGLLGFQMNENANFLQLSDGGHFENLGLYELVRRKMDLIIVSDGGQDGSFSFADLGNAIERVRVDFGVSIHFDDPDFTPDGVLPQPRDPQSDTWSKKFGLAKRGFALASIYYPDRKGECGVLIYVKATMIEKLPSDLYAYKAENDEFPDQSTLDQFFDEDQFEAYRELGYRLTKQMTFALGAQPDDWTLREPTTRVLARKWLAPNLPKSTPA
jgi:hypothetical protein